MKHLSDYIGLPYADFARGPEAYDCWGLARSVHHEVFGGVLLPSFEATNPDDKRSMTRHAQGELFTPCEAKVGALAFAWIGKVCTHIGIAVGGGCIMEAVEGAGVCIVSVQDFERHYSVVTYHWPKEIVHVDA